MVQRTREIKRPRSIDIQIPKMTRHFRGRGVVVITSRKRETSIRAGVVAAAADCPPPACLQSGSCIFSRDAKYCRGVHRCSRPEKLYAKLTGFIVARIDPLLVGTCPTTARLHLKACKIKSTLH